MQNEKQALGNAGEQLAEELLASRGYVILERKYRCPIGEVDLVAMDGSVVAFIEVKTRRSQDYGSPFEAVTRSKQRQVIRVAKYYVMEHRLEDRNVRFDVVGIWEQPDEPRCELIQNAFQMHPDTHRRRRLL